MPPSPFPTLFYKYQRSWLQDHSRFKIGLWARQTGKDFTCAAEAVFDCLATPRNHWLIVACGERQAIESLQHAKYWAHFCNSEFKNQKSEILFPNGSRITALPARPGTIRGYSANLILTEFAFHDDPEAIWKAIFPSVTNPLRGGPKKLRVISTPNGQGNYFHKLWTESAIFGKQKTTIHDARADGLPIDLTLLRQGIITPEAWAQEYECQFIDQTSVLLPYDLIEQCELPEATETFDLSTSTGELFLGIDFGRKQDLTVCWVLEKLPPNRTLNPNLNLNPPPNHQSSIINHQCAFLTREVLILQRTPTPAQFEALQPRLQRARRACIDYTGAGIGLGDALARQFGSARSATDWGSKLELCTFTSALKEEIFVKLRAAFERRSLYIPRHPDIREDLHALHRVVSPSGQISFRASHTADGHSDRCTALALALRAAESAPAVARASSVGSKFRTRRNY